MAKGSMFDWWDGAITHSMKTNTIHIFAKESINDLRKDNMNL